MKILFADDETSDLYDVLPDDLRGGPLKAEVVVSQMDASEVLEDLKAQGPFDLVILDIMMPPGEDERLAKFGPYDAGVGVYEIMRRGRETELAWAQKVKVLILTANRDELIKKRIQNAPRTTAKNLRIVYKPEDDVLKYIVDFVQEDKSKGDRK